MEHYEIVPGGICLRGQDISLKIEFAARNMVRMWSTLQGEFRQEETLVVERSSFEDPGVCITEQENLVTLSTGELTVLVHRKPFYVQLQDAAGKTVFSTPEGETISRTGQKLIQRFDLPEGVRVYGLGQSSIGELDLRGWERRMWHQWDGFRYSGNGGIPFLMTSQGCGLLLNSSWASRFVLGEGKLAPKTEQVTPPDPWGEKHSGEGHPLRGAILPEGGDLDLFIIHGPAYPDILRGYAELVGKPPVIPKWALGYMQSKFGYKNQDEALEVANEMRRKGIAGDVLIIDLDWFRHFADLDWIKPYWPDPEQMLRQLRSLGFRAMVVSEPFVDTRSVNFEEFNRKGYLYDWKPTAVNSPVDLTHYAVDQTDPAAQKLWWEKLKKLYDQGIRGFWCDMGEPQNHPEDTRDLHLGCREKVHNIYNLAWSKGIYENQRAYTDERPFNLFRTMYAGIHRYSAASWSGDVDCTWEVLQDQVVVGQQVCLSGQPYWGTDIGGLMYTERYDPELFVRWLQWGAFCPVFRTHGIRYNNEPWSYGEQAEAIIKQYIGLRYRLMPYIYTYAYETSQTFAPMMRPMFYAFPEDRQAREQKQQFMFGDSLLVAPVTEKGARTKKVWLPEGVWHDFWTGKAYTGGCWVEVFAPLDTLPLFVRGGSVIPMAEPMLHTNAQPLDRLQLHVYPGSDGSFTLYEDDGYTYAYEKGQFAKTRFIYEEGAKKLTIAGTEGGYAGMPWARTYAVTFHDANQPETVLVNGKETPWQYDAKHRALTVTVEQLPVTEQAALELIGAVAAEVSGEETALRYDLEYLPETETQRLGCRIRVYGKENDRVAAEIPVGWQCLSTQTRTLATGQQVTEWLLQMAGREYTATGTVLLTLHRGDRTLTEKVPLLSGWVTWWKLAGPYLDGPEGFDTEYLPEQQLCIAENRLEAGIRVEDFKRFECFGYVPVQRVFKGEKNISATANFTLNCVDRTCYAGCTAILPEDRVCTVKLMGEDKLKLWVNGKLQLASDLCHGTPLYSRVKLKKGKNKIFIKCSQFQNREADVWSERAWGFYFTIVDDSRRSMDDIIYCAE